MSSVYRLVCMEHTPAIDVRDDLTLEEAEYLARNNNVEGHLGCELLIARSSGATIEIGCIGKNTGRHRHSSTSWIDTEWLALASTIVAIKVTSDNEAINKLHKVLEHYNFGCWNIKRLTRLYGYLRLHRPDYWN